MNADPRRPDTKTASVLARFERVTSRPSPSRRSGAPGPSRRGTALGAIAAGALATVVLGVVVLRPPAPGSVVTASPSRGTISSSPSAVSPSGTASIRPSVVPPSATATMAGPAWTLIDEEPFASFTAVTDVVAQGPGGIALAQLCGRDCSWSFLSSDDGRRWRVRGEIASDADTVRDVAYVDDGYVAIGAVLGRPAVWLSADGSSWESVAHQPAFDPGGDGANGGGREDHLSLRLVDIESTPSGLLVVGVVACTDCPIKPRAAVLHSRDGRSWERDPPPRGISDLGDLAVRDGVIVADEAGVRVWTSRDGKAWSAAGIPLDERDGSYIADIAAVGPGFVAVGQQGADAAAWVSSDGRSWRRAPTGQTFIDGQLHRVDGADDVILAAGRTASAGELVPAVWRSADGLAWERDLLPSSGAASTLDVALVAGAPLAVGASEENAPDQRGVLWRAAAP